jgi:type I restriction-modification system DNA methylase subunit
MANVERQQTVLNILQNLHQTKDKGLKELFWTELNYGQANKPLSPRKWPESATKHLADDPTLFAAGGEGDAFQIIYTRLAADSLLRGAERPVVGQLLRDHPYALFVFSNKAQTAWHFLNVKYEQDVKQRRLLRRIAVGPDERLRTAAERLCMIDLSQIGGDLFGLSPMAIQERHDEAFDVEAVTKQFFIEYRSVFQLLQDDLARQSKDKDWAHDYALQFLNRCMFLYFIQRKRWLGQDNEFLRTYWETYQKAKAPADTFFPKWLKVLFFEAFNRKVTAHHRHLPDEIRKILATAPYLNGGLFTQNELDDEDRHSFTVSDARFGQVFKFLERYNFTITEDSPLDQEVAVDPEMIGKVYESLVNVSAEADERGDAGIFYTPRTEIDLMCRLTLVDQLSNHVGDKHRNLFYELVFAIEPDEKTAADAAVAKAGLWPAVTETLRGLTVVDPACGSGSFLVGMLYILDDLQNRAQAHGAAKESAFERRKRVIGQNLYGVDVMDWACHVAELRLWLALVVDAQFSQAELSIRKEPLLPHFTFKIRQGDSLVQEVGGVNLGRLHSSRDIKPALKARITALKNEKLKFYQNDPDRRYRTADQVRQEELRLFRDILDARAETIEAEIKSNRQRLEGKTANLFGEQVAADSKLDSAKQRAALEAKTVELTAALDKARAARAALKTAQNVPFVWDIAFVEVFEDEKDGFDIVIGNPPYVRQENIADPRLGRDDVTTENKREYKDKLARAVYQAFPGFFGYNSAADRVADKLDAKSDLYIYFHFVGLWLLNPKGSFTFICSNSWLDVGYGAQLQEFLLRQCHVKYVVDNSVERSFDSAEVNTIIVLISAPSDRKDDGVKHTARFVMFKVPFETVLSPILFQEIEAAGPRKLTPEYRLFAEKQSQLFLAGCVPEDEEDSPANGEVREPRAKYTVVVEGDYGGDKWGGKYLRAPDIYWKITENLQSQQPKRLRQIAAVKRGVTSGVNEFFHFDGAKAREWGVERRYLRPLIKTPRDYYGIRIPGSEVLLFWCQDERKDLKGTKALEYIEWGEAQGFHKAPSCASRRNWYALKGPEKPTLLWPSAFFERHIVYECPKNYVADKVFYTISGDAPLGLRAYLNSSLVSLFVEVEGYQLNHGGIFVTTDWLGNLPVLAPPDSAVARPYERIASREIRLCADELDDEGRKALDLAILKRIGLGEAELSSMYEAIKSYVAGRIHKAKRETTQRGRQPDLKQAKKRQKAADSLRGIWSELPDKAMKELLE